MSSGTLRRRGFFKESTHVLTMGPAENERLRRGRTRQCGAFSAVREIKSYFRLAMTLRSVAILREPEKTSSAVSTLSSESDPQRRVCPFAGKRTDGGAPTGRHCGKRAERTNQQLGPHVPFWVWQSRTASSRRRCPSSCVKVPAGPQGGAGQSVSSKLAAFLAESERGHHMELIPSISSCAMDPPASYLFKGANP